MFYRSLQINLKLHICSDLKVAKLKISRRKGCPFFIHGNFTKWHLQLSHTYLILRSRILPNSLSHKHSPWNHLNFIKVNHLCHVMRSSVNRRSGTLVGALWFPCRRCSSLRFCCQSFVWRSDSVKDAAQFVLLHLSRQLCRQRGVAMAAGASSAYGTFRTENAAVPSLTIRGQCRVWPSPGMVASSCLLVSDLN